MVHSQLGTVSGPIMYPLTSTTAALRADQQGCQKRLNGCSSRQPSGQPCTPNSTRCWIYNQRCRRGIVP